MTSNEYSAALVVAILMSEGTATEIAKRHQVSRQTVRLYKTLKLAKAREACAALRAQGAEPIIWSEESRREVKFTPEQVAAIRADTRASRVVASEYGCSSALVRMIRTGAAYG